MKNKLITYAILPAMALGLAACGQQDYGISKTTDNVMRGNVQMVRLPYTISAEPDGTETPSHVTYAALDKFLTSTDAGYGDVILLDTGADISNNRVDAIASYIKARGLEYGGVHVLGPVPASGETVLYLERYIYEAPSCDNWEAELFDDRKNNPRALLGCSNERALGMMVADPRDLVSGRSGQTRTEPSVKAVAAERAAPAKGGKLLPKRRIGN